MKGYQTSIAGMIHSSYCWYDSLELLVSWVDRLDAPLGRAAWTRRLDAPLGRAAWTRRLDAPPAVFTLMAQL